ncbi:MAG: HIRAN domain-containing protein [Burkholderiales bacterium]
MPRFLLAGALALLLAGGVAAQTPRILVQSSPLAGFRYYDAGALWEEMKVGDALTLVREPGNPYDANAVRVEWNGRKLGYVPQRDNADVARQLDRGAPLKARISRLQMSRSPSKRIEFEIYVDL